MLHGESKFALSDKSWVFDTRVPVAHVYEPGSCPSKDQKHAENRNKMHDCSSRPQGHEEQNHFGVSSGTSESGMSLGGDDKTKHDINSSMR